jgi:hypothetical protein
MISIGTVHFTDRNAVLIDQAEANHSVAGSAELLSCQTLTGGFRAFTCCFPDEVISATSKLGGLL